MRSGTDKENAHSESLRKDYKGAFDEWALQVNRLQAIADSPEGSIIDGVVMKAAEDRAAAAEIAYRDSRDRLTDDMGGPTGDSLSAGLPGRKIE